MHPEVRYGSPRLDGVRYVLRTPPWLVWLVRALFLAFALTTGYLALSTWGQLTAVPRLLVAVLVPALLVVALNRRIWQRTVKFIADESGIHFPHNSLLVAVAGQPAVERWLFVPWACVETIRVGRTADLERSRAVCLDIEVSDAEAAEFFAHVDRAGGPERTGRLSLAYDDVPPRPARTVEALTSSKRSAGGGARIGIGVQQGATCARSGP